MNPSPFSQEGYDLMGAAFEVHRIQGGGMAEEIYQQSLEIELASRGVPFQSKQKLDVFYKGQKLTTHFIPDLVVHEAIVVELKALSGLTKEHAGQLMNYMRVTRNPVGYLVNFGPLKEVEWKRFVLSEYA